MEKVFVMTIVILLAMCVPAIRRAPPRLDHFFVAFGGALAAEVLTIVT